MNLRLPLAICAVALAGTLCRADLQSVQPLVIISPHGEDIKTEFARAFEVWHEKKYGQRVAIDWRTLGGTNDDLRFVLNEFKTKPDGIGIDIFFGGGDDPFYKMAAKGLLNSYRPRAEILERLPQDIGGVPMYDTKNFTWYGFATAGFGIAYNKRVLRYKNFPEPKTWTDLTLPELQGWISSGDPRNSGSTHNMYELILQAYGWEKGWAIIYQMGANARSFEKSSAAAVKECTLGNTAYALAIDFYAFTQVEHVGKENFSWTMPPEIAVMNPDGIAILRGTLHQEQARHFIDFVLGDEGQKLIFLPRGHPEGPQQFNIARMCLRQDFYDRFREISPVTANPFTIRTVHYDAAKGSDRTEIVNALIGATVIDTHDEAVAAWRRIHRQMNKLPLITTPRRPQEEMVREFSEPPLNEDDATVMAKEKWKDARFRNHQIVQWQCWAQQKYRQIKP